MSIVGSEQWMYSSGREFYEFPLEQSLRFEDGDSAYLSRTPASAGNRKTFTYSTWVKRGNLGLKTFISAGTGDTARTLLFFDGSDKIVFGNNTGSGYFGTQTNAVFRDVSAWYHIVFSIDTTQATTADRVKIYVNGVQQTDTSAWNSGYIAQNADTYINNTSPQVIGSNPLYGVRDFYDGFKAEVNLIDGTAYDASYFGELKSGIWTPKDPTGLTYGTNGFRLNFADTTTASGVNALTWTGDAANPKSVNGCGFSPDFVWAKARSSAFYHRLYDSVRGANKALFSNATSAETTDVAGEVTSFDSDGFTFSGSTNNSNLNNNGTTYVAWCWDAGSGSPVSNTDGSITSTVKANTDYGFSITSYVGTGANATVGHGLTTAPELIFVRNRSGGDFKVYSEAVGNTYQGFLNGSDAFQNTGATIWNNTSPTSSVFSIGTNGGVNQSGANLIAYAFHSVTGYSKISTYTGTGVSGLSVTGLGFKPAFLMVKSSTAAEPWNILDNTRETFPDEKQDLLLPNLANAETTMSGNVEFTDDGFNVNTTIGNFNTSGQTYLFMAFKDTRDAAFWRDVSGQGNDWQHNNLTFSDVVPDAPSNNFAVLNPLSVDYLSQLTYAEGNLRAINSTVHKTFFANMGVSSGKWYWEAKAIGGNKFTIGLTDVDNQSYKQVAATNAIIGYTPSGLYAYGDAVGVYARTLRKNGSTVASNLWSSFADGDIMGIAFDADAGKVWFHQNGIWSNGAGADSSTLDPSNHDTTVATGETYIPAFSIETPTSWYTNFGQDSTFAGNKAAGGNADENGLGDFQYAVPSGFLSLNSANLPKGAIDTLADETPTDYFDTILYTAATTNGTFTHGDLTFRPDFSWIKCRNASERHFLIDVVRGNTSITDKYLVSNSTVAEGANNTSGTTFSVTDTGYEFVETSINTDELYFNGRNYVGWNWKANGAGVSNTDGSITSTVSVGATSQQNWFSVVKYTGTGGNDSYGHGLNIAPNMVITKDMTDPASWAVYVSDIGTGKYLQLNSTAGTVTNSVIYPSVSSTTIGVGVQGDGSITNTSGDNYISYCFANAEGLCKVGSYIGNGSTDGPMIWTGHRPSFVMIKRTNSTGSWVIQDSTRNPYNDLDLYLLAESSNAEATLANIADYCSNGFKLRLGATSTNASGSSYIYLSIAEQPFKYANAR